MSRWSCLTFAAVPLVCLDGRGETLRAALRYLLFALLGSMLYLLGVVLLYGAYGTLDIPLLATRVRPEPVAWAAAALMTRDSSPRPRFFRCICGFRRPMPARPPRRARYCRRWW